jgi:hypothetical protein
MNRRNFLGGSIFGGLVGIALGSLLSGKNFLVQKKPNTKISLFRRTVVDAITNPLQTKINLKPVTCNLIILVNGKGHACGDVEILV